MISRIHQKLGTAGFIISIVALVAALGGGAYAAKGGLTGKQKKEVTKVAQAEAKKYAGKPGPAGPAGPVGPAGPSGGAGAKGDPGSAGASGHDGVGVTTAPAGAECPEGGTKFTSANGTSHVCNGEEGQQGRPGEPWSVGNVLPSEAMETGTYLISSESGIGTHFGIYSQTDISFTIPLAAEIPKTNTIWVKAGTTPMPAECENVNHAGVAGPANPEAAPGFLCVFEGRSLGFSVEESGKGIFKPDGPFAEGAGVSGASLLQEPEEGEAFAEGTWAVTAP